MEGKKGHEPSLSPTAEAAEDGRTQLRVADAGVELSHSLGPRGDLY